MEEIETVLQTIIDYDSCKHAYIYMYIYQHLLQNMAKAADVCEIK